MNGCEQVCVCLCVCVNKFMCVCARARVRALKCGGGNWGGVSMRVRVCGWLYLLFGFVCLPCSHLTAPVSHTNTRCL